MTCPPPPLVGLVIPLVTPFTERGEVDHRALAHNVQYTLDLPGCGGVYVGSVYQEFWSLSTAERTALLDVVCEVVDGTVPVVAGVSSSSLSQAIELTEHAHRVGADYLMVWPPTWGPRDEDGVDRFLRSILERSSLPAFVYTTNLPELGFTLLPERIARLADQHPVLYGVKDGRGSVTSYLLLTATLGDRLAVASPFEEYYAASIAAMPDKTAPFLLGSSRAMYMQTRTRPYVAEAVRLAADRQTQASIACLAQIGGLVDAQMDSFRRGVHPIAMVRYACGLLGQVVGSTRPPTPELHDGARAAVRELLKRHGLLEGAQ